MCVCVCAYACAPKSPLGICSVVSTSCCPDRVTWVPAHRGISLCMTLQELCSQGSEGETQGSSMDAQGATVHLMDPQNLKDLGLDPLLLPWKHARNSSMGISHLCCSCTFSLGNGNMDHSVRLDLCPTFSLSKMGIMILN